MWVLVSQLLPPEPSILVAMQQFVYVLEVVRGSGYIRAHFAQTAGAAQRRASRSVAGGVWVETGEAGQPLRLLDGQRELARVVRETVDYG
ncbi:MAG: hypothetical protein JWQ08_631 [Deinococcus sp.]|nr:hypothetical protein [Deinococcus sp.]